MALSGRGTPSVWDFSVAFLAVSVLMLAAVPVAFLMPREAGDDLAGRAPRVAGPPVSPPGPRPRQEESITTAGHLRRS